MIIARKKYLDLVAFEQENGHLIFAKSVSDPGEQQRCSDCGIPFERWARPSSTSLEGADLVCELCFSVQRLNQAPQGTRLIFLEDSRVSQQDFHLFTLFLIGKMANGDEKAKSDYERLFRLSKQALDVVGSDEPYQLFSFLDRSPERQAIKTLNKRLLDAELSYHEIFEPKVSIEGFGWIDVTKKIPKTYCQDNFFSVQCFSVEEMHWLKKQSQRVLQGFSKTTVERLKKYHLQEALRRFFDEKNNMMSRLTKAQSHHARVVKTLLLPEQSSFVSSKKITKDLFANTVRESNENVANAISELSRLKVRLSHAKERVRYFESVFRGFHAIDELEALKQLVNDEADEEFACFQDVLSFLSENKDIISAELKKIHDLEVNIEEKCLFLDLEKNRGAELEKQIIDYGLLYFEFSQYVIKSLEFFEYLDDEPVWKAFQLLTLIAHQCHIKYESFNESLKQWVGILEDSLDTIELLLNKSYCNHQVDNLEKNCEALLGAVAQLPIGPTLAKEMMLMLDENSIFRKCLRYHFHEVREKNIKNISKYRENKGFERLGDELIQALLQLCDEMVEQVQENYYQGELSGINAAGVEVFLLKNELATKTKLFEIRLEIKLKNIYCLLPKSSSIVRKHAAHHLMMV